MLALVAESVDALDLKSNWGSTSVPVQVWPRAIIIEGDLHLQIAFLFCILITLF